MYKTLSICSYVVTINKTNVYVQLFSSLYTYLSNALKSDLNLYSN